MKHYLPEEVPNNLFTRSRLSRMGLSPSVEHVAFVVYPEQKQEFKLYDIGATRSPKRQKGLSLVQKDATIEQILAERKHELEVRKRQFGTSLNE